MNARKFIGASVLTIALMLGAVGNVSATTNDECKALIDTLSSAVAGVEIGGRNDEQTRASLQSKLLGAKNKIDQAKLDKACIKIQQFEQKVFDLADALKAKMSVADAVALITGAQGVEDCLDDLIDDQVDGDCEAVTVGDPGE